MRNQERRCNFSKQDTSSSIMSPPTTTTTTPTVSMFLRLLMLQSLVSSSLSLSSSLGGELLTYTTPPFSNVTHRQDICERYEQFRSGEIELRYALDGLALRPIIRMNDYFNYDYETGINSDDPGLQATLLDELADRAGFTWRDSFAILERPTDLNFTWTFTDLLIWSVDTYDVAINWWDQSVERMERGVAYIEPWFDGSVILIDQEDPPEEKRGIDVFNWLRPFETSVWIFTIITIFISGVVHQLIEYLNDERNERSLWQWFADNTYLSWLNVTQNFEYAPNSTFGRMFGVSMGIWALVLTATYTANLASLLVEQKEPGLVVDSIEQAVVLGIPICTYGNTNADVIIKKRHGNAIREPYESELAAYEALRRGECGLVAGYKDSWLGYRQDKRYNPECDLAWVGRTVEVIKSGFATKADAGHKCSSLIRDVFNLHLTELIVDGVLEDVWQKHRDTVAAANAINCDADTTNPDEEELNGGSVRFLQPEEATTPRSSSSEGRRAPTPYNQRRGRKLKGGGGGGGNSSAANSAGGEGERLTISQMAGIFLLHYVTMVCAIMVSATNRFLRKRKARLAAKNDPTGRRAQFTGKMTVDKRVSFRAHGPIIGAPPPINTIVKSTVPTYYDGGASLAIQAARNPIGGMNHRASFRAHQSPTLGQSSNRLQNMSDFFNIEEGEEGSDECTEHSTNNTTTIQDSDDTSAILRKLSASIQTTKQEMKDSQGELRTNQLELAQQMNAIMGMLQELTKQSGGGGLGSDVVYTSTAESLLTGSQEDQDANKDHRD